MSARVKLNVPFTVITALVLIAASSCGSLPFMGDRSASTESPSESTSATVAEAPVMGDGEAELRRIVEQAVDRANANHDTARAELIRKKPYFYKQYEYYPDGILFMDVSTRETESRTAPMVADVQLRKQRFVTKLHRDKDNARADDDFLRDTGDETITYELRNGKWTRRSSLFVAESVERNIDGVWTPVEEVERTDDAGEEDELSWFGRVWQNVVGPR